MKKFFYYLIILLSLTVLSCTNPIDSSSSVSANNADADSGGAALYTDPSRGVIFVDESGSEIIVKSEEEEGEVICKDVIDYVIFKDTESVSRNAGYSGGRKRAVVLGYRQDGAPGLWIVYSNGTVKPVVNSENIETSELLEMVENRQPLFKKLGWSYKALDLVAVENEIIIIGYAENEEGISWHGTSIIDPGTTIGLYWPVIEDEEGYYHISRAKIIGYKDNSWWKRYMENRGRHNYRYRFRWLHSLRLFVFGWYDRYLIMPESIVPGDNAGEYIIKGTDDEGEASVAVVTSKRVLSIEKAPDDPDPPDPVTPAKMVFSSNRDGDYEIYSLDPETGTTVQLTDNSYTDKHPALSKDRTKIAFVSNSSGSWAIYVMNADGSGISGPVTALGGTNDGHPSWNPDGSAVVFDNNYNIYSVNSDGSGLTPLKVDPFENFSEPEWSPDGEYIAYSSSTGSDYEISVMKSDGTAATMLTANSASDQSPAWSPDGTSIAFTTDRNGNLEIYTMSSSGLNQVNFTNTSSAGETSPAWSTDGRIAYVKNGNDIYYRNADGSGSETLLIDDNYVNLSPSW